MQISTFTATKAPCSIRPSWVVAIAKLGRICGEDLVLVGVIRDINAQSGETDFGLATSADVSRIEAALGQSLDSVFDNGVTVEGIVRIEPRILTGIRPPEQITRVSLRGSHNQPATSSATCESDFVHRLAQQESGRVGFEAQKAKALSRRARWDVSDMRHREDFAPWLPEFAVRLIREESRHWMTLPPQLPASTKRLTPTATR